MFEKSVYRKWVETLKLYTRQRHDIQGPYGVFCVDLSYVLASFSRHGIQGPFCVVCVNLSYMLASFSRHDIQGPFCVFLCKRVYVLASFSRHDIQGPFCVFCVNLSTCWHLFLDTTFKGLFVFFG